MGRFRRRGWRAGVSLVEITVVSGLLSAMSGGSNAFLQVQNKALGTQCQMQLQQAYRLIQMYTDDNDGRLPRAWCFPWRQNAADPFILTNALGVRDAATRKLFICPAAPQGWLQLGLTYIYNDALSGQLLDNVPNPSMTWLMTDANIIDPRLPPPHLGGYNVLFCDGRVKWLPAEQARQFVRLPLPEVKPETDPEATEDKPEGEEGGAKPEGEGDTE